MMWSRKQPPDQNTSTWTVDTLLEYWRDRHVDLQLQMEQRFEAQAKAVDIAVEAHRASIQAALNASDKAISKSEEATEKRFDSVNEFRRTLSDQASLFITRKEAEASVERNAERIRETTNRLQDYALKSIVMAEYDRLSTQVQGLADRLNRSEGKGSGLAAGWGFLIAAVGVGGAIIAAYVALRS
jgi:hypothetical protein